jgi:hypothetical protein
MDIQKIIDDSKHKTYSKLSDKKLAQFDEFLTKGRGIGGNVMGNTHYKNLTGIFSMSKEKTKQTKINGGKAAGKLAVERGTVSKAGKASIESPNHVNNKRLTCPHCNKDGGYSAMKRHHMDRCKFKNID